MNPTTRASTARTALGTRATRPRAPCGPKSEPAGARKCQRRGLEIVVVRRVRSEHIVEHSQEAAVFGEGARGGRQRGGGADGEGRVGRRGGQVGEQVRRGRGERVGKDSLGAVACVC